MLLTISIYIYVYIIVPLATKLATLDREHQPIALFSERAFTCVKIKVSASQKYMLSDTCIYIDIYAYVYIYTHT